MLKLYPRVRRSAILLLCSAISLPAFSATFVVTNTNGSGPGSLAEAVANANANTADADVIEFNLPGAAPFTINLSAPLVITGPVSILGYTQPGAAAGTIAARTIAVNINAGAVTGNAFTVQANDVTISGLAIYGAPGYGIQAPAAFAVSNLFVWGNYIGTDNNGTTPFSNVNGNIDVNVGGGAVSSNIVIGVNGDNTNDANEGNLIVGTSSGSGSTGDGIALWYCNNSTIAGNIIGLNKNGNGTNMGNVRDGILLTVDCSNITIGTDGDGVSDALEGNIIGRNGRYGIQVAGRSFANIIMGNTIGLDQTGAVAPNAYGIELLNAYSNRIGTNSDGISDLLERNIISGNTNDGIHFSSYSFFGFDANTSNNVVRGNIIGTNAAGAAGLGNLRNGITLHASQSGFFVNDNLIGTNHDGVLDANEANVIAYNGLHGIRVVNPITGAGSTGNKFAGNRIYNNAQLGIDLQYDGGPMEPYSVNINDQDDVDAGANNLLNAPVLTTVQVDGSDLLVTGFTRPGSIVEFYVADAGPHPAPLPGGFSKDFGQGMTYLFRAQEGTTLNGIADDDNTTGSYDETIEGAGSGGSRTENRFTFRIPLSSLAGFSPSAGTRITSLAYETATGAGNTSEFGGVFALINLPVHFDAFFGRLQDGKAYLSWTTSAEENNSHFDIERSNDGAAYTKIGKVAPKFGVINQYEFTDAAPAPGVNYYRIRQIDLDGRPTLSKVVTLRSELGQFTAKVGPNPFAGSINVFYELKRAESLTVRLYDQGGRVIKQYNVRGGVGVNTYVIGDLQSLPKGQYTIELAGDSFRHRQQLIKQ
ncbi:T9SS type A sorting domain-containing protein [Paraflavitalea pollutisoli]|uniref:T9SS type A sorting domain-containing protein n=1 Tax=Paraflavitalea pollutisoli TaxID=3034143 RepID=UPI0023EB48E7|nr:T9SS type A sorting domain-containing protein [Paraflavitalea sp. H1-2-19X]